MIVISSAIWCLKQCNPVHGHLARLIYGSDTGPVWRNDCSRLLPWFSGIFFNPCTISQAEEAEEREREHNLSDSQVRTGQMNLWNHYFKKSTIYKNSARGARALLLKAASQGHCALIPRTVNIHALQ